MGTAAGCASEDSWVLRAKEASDLVGFRRRPLRMERKPGEPPEARDKHARV